MEKGRFIDNKTYQQVALAAIEDSFEDLLSARQRGFISEHERKTLVRSVWISFDLARKSKAEAFDIVVASVSGSPEGLKKDTLYWMSDVWNLSTEDENQIKILFGLI